MFLAVKLTDFFEGRFQWLGAEILKEHNRVKFWESDRANHFGTDLMANKCLMQNKLLSTCQSL